MTFYAGFLLGLISGIFLTLLLIAVGALYYGAKAKLEHPYDQQ